MICSMSQGCRYNEMWKYLTQKFSFDQRPVGIQAMSIPCKDEGLRNSEVGRLMYETNGCSYEASSLEIIRTADWR